MDFYYRGEIRLGGEGGGFVEKRRNWDRDERRWRL